MYDLVPPRLLSSSLALNSAQFHFARAVGPVVAGFVLTRAGASWTFLANAVSFLAVIVVLLLLHPTERPRQQRTGTLSNQIADGARYLWRRPPLRAAFLTLSTVAFFGNPILTLALPLAKEVFGADAQGAGLLTAGYGVGSAIGVVLLGRVRARGTPGALISVTLTAFAGLLVAYGAAARTLWACVRDVHPDGHAVLDRRHDDEYSAADQDRGTVSRSGAQRVLRGVRDRVPARRAGAEPGR